MTLSVIFFHCLCPRSIIFWKYTEARRASGWRTDTTDTVSESNALA